MSDKLKCFVSASPNANILGIINVLEENKIEIIQLYDLSIGGSIQEITKKKIKEADFVLFIISDDSPNVIYEMGVCDGIGKSNFVFLDKNKNTPIYIENKLYIRSDFQDIDFIRISIARLIKSAYKKVRKKAQAKDSEITKKRKVYNEETKESLLSCLLETQKLREVGDGIELELIVEKVFKAIKLNYVSNFNNSGDNQLDFAIWSNELGKIFGNPIIVEVKFVISSTLRLDDAVNQLQTYILKSDARAGILLYLDKEGKKHKTISSLNPLVLSFDAEDFINGLLYKSFEDLILSQRNEIAHGVK